MNSIEDQNVYVFDQYGVFQRETSLKELEYTGCSFTLHYISGDPYRWVIIDRPQDKGEDLKKAYEWFDDL